MSDNSAAICRRGARGQCIRHWPGCTITPRPGRHECLSCLLYRSASRRQCYQRKKAALAVKNGDA